ncbi:SET domain-containing protein [Favolaschia claudopus]|uniref:SET domain-containing protein n=1 Tax=Favolaschia claudopus TaxID=2862362 RepID=A0AAW0A4L4_9AGAR
MVDILQDLKSWFEVNGGFIHPDVSLIHCEMRMIIDFQAVYGISAIASKNIPADSKIVSCPFDLVITKDTALNALSALLGSASTAILQNWTERQLISVYLSLHWIAGDGQSWQNILKHFPYVKSLPPRDNLRTPLHFSPAELELLRGSNLYGATLDRQREWKAEWEECRNVVRTANEEWADLLTWDSYLTSATHLSSRAFPSTLISRNLALPADTPVEAAPVLLPGVDSLNHARAEPVSWIQSYLGSGPVPNAESNISVIHHNPIVAGTEVFNNYGAKPNSELILGYGFSLPNNPDDTIALKIGGQNGGRWEVGRDGRGAEPVWDFVLASLAEEGTEPTYEDHLDASEMLADMAQDLMQKLPDIPTSNPTPTGVREDVASMVRHYIEGQREILESLIEYGAAKEWHGDMPEDS